MTPPLPSKCISDDVLSDLVRWHSENHRVALITLVEIDGATPRPLGAQMAVCENGSVTGYLSGGCIERSVAEEAMQAIAAGKNRRVRYGKGSPYFDIQLPCGSGLDLYMDQGISAPIIAQIADHTARRIPFVLATDLTTGSSAIENLSPHAATGLVDGIFRRLHCPALRVLLVGGGPALIAIAQMVVAAGLELDIVSPDAVTRTELQQMGFTARPLVNPKDASLATLDHWTAAIVAFHEHEWEAPVLAEIMRTPCFYIGAMGSRAAHASRLERLSHLGVAAELQNRIRSPIGLIPGAKSRTTLAVGILAEVIAEAKAAGMLA